MLRPWGNDQVLLPHLNRAGTSLRSMSQELLTWDHWSVLWPAAIVAGLLLIIRTRVITWYPLVFSALLPLLLYPCVFLFSAWVPFEAHVGVALPRLFIHNAPAAVLLLSIACGLLLGFGKDDDVANSAGTRIAESSMVPLQSLQQFLVIVIVTQSSVEPPTSGVLS
jgi:hypothetical protein